MTDWPRPFSQSEAWTHLDTQVLAAPAASVSFTGIGATASVRMRLYAYMVQDGTPGSPRVRLNNDAGANYNRQSVNASAGVVTPARAVGQTQMAASVTILANEHGFWLLNLAKVAATEVGRAIATLAIRDTVQFEAHSFDWTNAADLINRVDLLTSAGNFVAGTRVVLEGAQ